MMPAEICGYKRRTLSGNCAEWLCECIVSGPIASRGLTAELAERGITTQPRTALVFLHAEGLSFKKLCCPRSRHPLTWPANGYGGRRIRVGSRRSAWSSSRRR